MIKKYPDRFILLKVAASFLLLSGFFLFCMMPQNPAYAQARVTQTNTISETEDKAGVFLFIAAVVGIPLLIQFLAERKMRQKLSVSGVAVEGQLEGTVLSSSLGSNHLITYEFQGKIYKKRFVGSFVLRNKQNGPIHLLVDPANPKKFVWK